MPRISEFYGILISMYFEEHDPPHVHALYGGKRVRFIIDPLEPMDRDFPVRALRLVRTWAELHQEELRANWERARKKQPLDRIAPLP